MSVMFRRLRASRGNSNESRFRQAILDRYGISSDKVDDPTVQMWVDFSLSSVDRGRQAVAAMGGRSSFARRQVLDVGCAYGGFLVAAAEAGAARVVGIDINPELLALAKLQLQDHAVDGQVAVDDVVSDGLATRWGKFDVVLCNDVIEHVTEPSRCAANLASILRPGGKLFLEIPNGLAIDFIRKDGHYGLFGITLLGRNAAEQWWGRFFGDTYGVEHYASLAYYLQIFSEAGIALRLLSEVEDREARMAEIEEAFNALEAELADLDGPETPDLVDTIRLRGTDEITHYRQLRSRYLESTVTAERDIILRDIVTTYGLTFWTLEGTRL
jgi:2-polyprenyl-3-methyl-5-hydroxy-6-metoxy-1,4-benzoquinol methylase